MDLMEDIEYGFLNKNGENIFLNENVEKKFNKEYHLMSPKELLIKKLEFAGIKLNQKENYLKIII